MGKCFLLLFSGERRSPKFQKRGGLTEISFLQKKCSLSSKGGGREIEHQNGRRKELDITREKRKKKPRIEEEIALWGGL